MLNIIMKISKYTLLVGLTICLVGACSSNKDGKAGVDPSLPALQAEYDKWKVFTIEQDGKRICYTTSTPIEEKGNHQSLVFSESNVGTYSVDTYSLSGFKKALQKAQALCQ